MSEITDNFQSVLSLMYEFMSELDVGSFTITLYADGTVTMKLTQKED